MCRDSTVRTWVFGLLLTLLFSSPSSIHRNYSTALIAVQPSFSAFRCKALNIFIKMCYSLPCTLAQSSEPCSPATRSFLLPHYPQPLNYYSYANPDARPPPHNQPFHNSSFQTP